MKMVKRALSLLLVAVMLVSVFAVSAVPASAAAFTIQRQWDSKWKNYYVGGRTMYDTACGIFSMVNAIGYLTGSAPEVYTAAKWANSIGAFNAGFGGKCGNKCIFKGITVRAYKKLCKGRCIKRQR